MSEGRGSQIATFALSPGSASVTLDDTKTALDGMSVSARPNWLPSSISVTVSYKSLAPQVFDDIVRPCSPLIKVSVPGASDTFRLQIKLPARLNLDEAAIAVEYDPTAEALKPIPLSARDSTSVTFDIDGLGSTGSEDAGFFVTSCPIENLVNRAKCGYRVGVDDCPMINYTSRFAPGGQCTGQAVLSIWYFSNQKAVMGQALYPFLDRFDNPDGHSPDYWKGDSPGYRLAAFLQRSIGNESSAIDGFWAEFEGLAPAVVFQNVLYSIAISGRPQLLALRKENSSHAVVAYAATRDSIYVADPNYPGVERRIEFTDGQFKPYTSRISANAKAEPYDTFFVVPTRYLISNSEVSAGWAALLAKGEQATGHGGSTVPSPAFRALMGGPDMASLSLSAKGNVASPNHGRHSGFVLLAGGF